MDVATRSILKTRSIGAYSELIAAAAFVASGAEVAYPMCSNPGWDLVVKEFGGTWVTVQVRTIGKRAGKQTPYMGLRVKTKDGSQRPNVDVFVAVCPQTGTIWKVPFAEAPGGHAMRLEEKHLWRGSIKRSATPLESPEEMVIVDQRISACRQRAEAQRDRLRLEREDVLRKMNEGLRPATVSEEAWEATLRWAKGEGFKSLGRSLGLSPAGVRVKVQRVLYRIGHIPRLPWMDRWKKKGEPAIV